tara:strand:- start:162 stop:314 length:153 start_codon:yes stop_codon:yes gene_type:complete
MIKSEARIVIKTDIVYKIIGPVDKIIAIDKIPDELRAEALRMEIARLEGK